MDRAIGAEARAHPHLGETLQPRTITLAVGAPVQVDAASPDGRVLAEICVRQGALNGGQQRKFAIDDSSMTVRRERPRSNSSSSASPTMRPPATPHLSDSRGRREAPKT